MKMQMGTFIEDVKYSDEFNTVAVTIEPAPGLKMEVIFPRTDETSNISSKTDGFEITIDMLKLQGGVLKLDAEAKYYNNQDRDAGTGEQVVTEVELTGFELV